MWCSSPAARAMSLAFWMTGPSITGSEYGSSTSMTSQPASCMAIIEAMLSSTVGKPDGMQPTSTLRPSAFALPNVAAMLTLCPLWHALLALGPLRSLRCGRSCRLPGHQGLDRVEQTEIGAGGVDVLVATPGQIHHDRR